MTTYMFIHMYVLVFSLIQVQAIVMKFDGAIYLIADQNERCTRCLNAFI